MRESLTETLARLEDKIKELEKELKTKNNTVEPIDIKSEIQSIVDVEYVNNLYRTR